METSANSIFPQIAILSIGFGNAISGIKPNIALYGQGSAAIWTMNL